MIEYSSAGCSHYSALDGSNGCPAWTDRTQLPYNGSQWDCSQQQQILPEHQQVQTQQQQQHLQSWQTTALEPKVGLESMAELRLAELKRLIDLDADALRQSSEAAVQQPGTWAETRATAASSKDATRGLGATKFDKTKENAGGKEVKNSGGIGPDMAAGVGAHHVRARNKMWRGAEADKAVGNKQPAKAAEGGGTSAHQNTKELQGHNKTRCSTVLHDFFPDSRGYGEMPIRAGEKLYTDDNPVKDWIFATRRGLDAEEGWVPASAVGLSGDATAQDEDAEAAKHAHRGPNKIVQQPTCRASRSKGGAPVGGSTSEKSVPGTKQVWSPANSGKPRRLPEYGQGSSELDAPLSHHHRNWRSRQRHLKGDPCHRQVHLWF